MSNEKDTTKAVLIPLEVRKIDFHGDEITAALVMFDEQPQIYVPIRPICDYLGLTWSGQYERTKRDPILAEALSTVRVTRTEVGQSYNVICVQLEMLPGWLFGINSNRVKPELREKIDRYRRECFRVLWQAFQADALSLMQLRPTPTDETIKTLQQVRQNALAVVMLTEEQIELTNRVAAHDLRFDRAVEAFRGLRQRIEIVEQRAAPPVFIRDDQAAHIFNQVKALAEFLTSKDNSKDHYGAVFGAIYRQFDISSYHRVRQAQFETVMKFLADWHQAANTGHLEAPRQLGLFDPPPALPEPKAGEQPPEG